MVIKNNMVKSKIREKLESMVHRNQGDVRPLEPDNHDYVKIAIGVLNAESAEQLSQQIDILRKEIPTFTENIGLFTGRLRDTITESLGTLTTEIKNYSEASNKQAKAMYWLTWVLVAATVLQAIGIILPFILKFIYYVWTRIN